jgi:hypothetical protein
MITEALVAMTGQRVEGFVDATFSGAAGFRFA